MRKSILGINRKMILFKMEDKLQFSKNFRIFGLKSSLLAFKSKSNEKESESVLSEVERSFYESQFYCFTVVQCKTYRWIRLNLSFFPQYFRRYY
jgi:hypothetical protein